MSVAVVQHDEQLIERFLVGAPGEADSAFEALVTRHRPTVMSVCRRVLAQHEDAEDAVQATFMALIRNARRIRNQRNLGSWLYAVAYRIAMRTRARSARRLVIHGQAGQGPRPAPAEDAAPFRELRQIVREEVDHLPEDYRKPVVQSYMEGKTCAEVARNLGCPIGTVKGRLWRARRMLRVRLIRRVRRPSELFA
jgi:RNA polymerase sigma-70 factor (ECF subfamily)